MSQQGALILMIGIAVVLLGLMLWGWIRRIRRDRGAKAPFGSAPAEAAVRGTFPGLYVATTAHGAALERLAIGGLAYRAQALVTVTDAGILLELQGQGPIFIDAARVESAAQATVAIDRVVERDGLARVSWRLDDGTTVDSYVRPQEASARELAAAVSGILPAHDAMEGDS
ncbi:hypothetical protein ABCS02_24605 [Microbacterium sp. X-17]|uniref:PH-like domain-containing protein n=1 Tax=Microbacterium sp. X-17 TaxID=3144404 RepID=UPI0031F5A624